MNRRIASPKRLAHLIAISVVAMAAMGVSPARADKYLDGANRAAAATSGTRPVEETLFPVLASMDEPPVRVGMSRDEMRELMLAAEGDASWDALTKWAEAEPQQKVLEAMGTVTDPDHFYILGIPYGTEGAKPEWVDAGLYVELGPDGLLYGAKFRYMDRLSWAAGLALFEAARLANAGEGEEAMKVLGSLVRFSRILAERAFAGEKAMAITLALVTLERARDVVFTYSDAMTPELIETLVEKIEFKALNADKIPLPEADRLAAEQIVDRAFENRGGAKPEVLAETMSRAEAGDRSLRLFSLAAWWATLAKTHADWFDTGDEIKGVWNDYVLRWKLDFNDPLLRRPSDFRQMDPKKFPVIYEAMKGIESLFSLRKSFWVDLGGTYNGLGVMAFKLKERNYPPQIAAIAPKYVKHPVKDMYHLDFRYVPPQMDDYPYWVPIRDQKFDRRERPHPYAITVFLTSPDHIADAPPPAPEPKEGEESAEEAPAASQTRNPNQPAMMSQGDSGSKAEPEEEEPAPTPEEAGRPSVRVPPKTFAAELDDSYFLLYSCGINERDDRARNVGPVGVGAEDILIWPPVIVLERRFNR